MEVITRHIADLEPYARNSRTHSPEQVAQLVASIREFGWTNPVLIDEHGGVIAGHGRIMAARELGMDDVPCIVLTGLTEAQKRAYVIADNKLALNSGWDEDMLRLELGELQAVEFNLDPVGFSSDEVDILFSPLGIDHDGQDHSGASPWERMSNDAAPGVLVTVGEITCRISNAAYESLLLKRPAQDISSWMEGLIYDACGRS